MRVIDSDKLDAANLLPHQRYFLEHWYSMTHMRSLDSYRVRCMNSRTIVRELSDELRVGLADDNELRNLCEETAATLALDPILMRRFPTTTSTIKPFLNCPPSVKENNDKKANAERKGKLREFSFAIEDLQVALERDYFDCLCNDLREAIKPDNEAEILSLTGSLLSDLVDRGWTLESLYRWHRHFLRKDVPEKYTFSQNLDFVLRQLSRSPQPFVVTLRLSGSNRLVGIAEYGGFSISTAPSLTPDAKNRTEQNFCKPHKTVCFATRTVEAVDHVSAAIHARSSFEQLLDLLCFDYERRTVKIEEMCFVERSDDGKRLLPQVLHAVPNPIETLDESEFLKFVADFDVVTKAERIASFSRWQLQAAIRQYRFGRDSEGYKDKFLNWWMGLEALAHVGRGKGIGPEVRHNVSRAMIHGYLFRMIRDLLGTIKHCQINWPRELASVTGCRSLNDLSVRQLIAVLQSDTEQKRLWEGCEQHPSLVFRGKAIAEWLGDPKKTAEQLELHRQHLEWHLDRLYRIRCCIVHGSPIRFKLGLFSANLEYYLKQLILFVLATFRDNEHIMSLEEVFRRTSIAYDRLLAGLKAEPSGQDEAREAVFADIVVKDPRQKHSHRDTMAALNPNLRNKLEKTVVKARDEAEASARAALERLAVDGPKPFEHLDEEQRLLRRKLRAHARQVGDKLKKNDSHEITHLVGECAYEHWHRMLFARFLAENSLLMHPEGVAVTLDECDELAAEEGTDRWTLAAEYASRMLPQIFRPDDPLLLVTLAPEDKRTLERLVADLPVDVFTADDSLGWCYQFWQTKRKEEVNKSEVDIGADELPAVTQLFTEDYMVRFLLHNSLGAWWSGKQQRSGNTEDQLRKSLSDTLEDYEYDYLRFIEDDGTWKPASGTFDSWPGKAAELKILDPCCGSGHFLVAVFELIARIRMAEEGLSRDEAADAVIRDNLFGLEIDPRCTQLAAFSVAMAAWRFCGGHRQLPLMNIACSGLAPHTKREDWKQLAGGDQNLSVALGWLYDDFKNAPTLGSLINPNTSESAKLVDWRQLGPLIQEATREETDDLDQHELGIAAQGIADAARLLAEKYHLVITNVPYLARGKHSGTLRQYIEQHHAEAKQDLATAFVERCLGFCVKGGSTALVTPQNWLFLKYYDKLRKKLLERETWNHVARLGSGAFDTITGEVVNVSLLIHTRVIPHADHVLTGLDASAPSNSREKAKLLATAEIRPVSQKQQLDNPTCVVRISGNSDARLLVEKADCFLGICTGDMPRFATCFWEHSAIQNGWRFFRSTPDETRHWAGMEKVIFWQDGNGTLESFVRERLGSDNTGAWIRGKKCWGKAGIAVKQMGKLPVSLYNGELFDDNVAVVIPNSQDSMPTIYSFCASEAFNLEVRKVNQKLAVKAKYFLQAEFDLDHWREVAAQSFPQGLPQPYTDDPTQWIFHGHPAGSVVWDEQRRCLGHAPHRTNDAVLQVAVARLLGYRWPAELDDEMELSDEARALVQRCDELLDLVDDDGIVGIPPVRGELPAADRVREMLARAYGDDWSPLKEGQLLAEAGFANKTLDQWLRDGFFKQHCKLFQNRPFIWHIWDGHKTGFQALVNYHRLADGQQGYKLLETLAFTYLGDWIRGLETAQGSDGTAETRLIHARALQENLNRILDGQSPHDIFVRWKPLEDQPIGWHPDLNDGVRMNIRPFLTVEQPGSKKGSGVLREKPNIKWTKDRGKDVESAPWYQLGPQYDGNPGDRINDHHLTLEEKQRS